MSLFTEIVCFLILKKDTVLVPKILNFGESDHFLKSCGIINIEQETGNKYIPMLVIHRYLVSLFTDSKILFTDNTSRNLTLLYYDLL